MNLNRRLFLKAMGLAGLVRPTNWFTLIKGPVPGDILYKGDLKTTWIPAAMPIKAHQFVEITPRGAAVCNDFNNVAGVAMYGCEKGQEVQIVVAGAMQVLFEGKK